jgi:hypothetical protein
LLLGWQYSPLLQSPARLSAGVLYTPALFWPFSHLVSENTLLFGSSVNKGNPSLAPTSTYI